MSTVIQIKRSANVTAPLTTDLAEGELAYSQDRSNDGAGAILYIESVDSGSSAVIHKVGGKYYTDLVDTANSESVASSLVQRDASSNFSANVITANEFIGNITGAINGEATSAAIATTANALTTARTITLDGDLEGAVSFDGSTDVTIYANVISNGVELGTDTTGDFVANVLAGTGIEVTGQGGEIANITVTLADTAVAPATYGSTENIPIIVVDQQGRITSASNASISTSLEIEADQGNITIALASDSLRLDGGSGIATESNDGNIITIVNVGVTSLAGTTNEIEVSSANGAITIGLPNSVTISNDLTVSGNLLVSGTAFTIDTVDLTVNDPLIHLANTNTSSDVVDIGFEGHYFDGATQRHAGLFRDADDGGIFKFFANVAYELENAVTINTSAEGYETASIVANLTGGNVYSLLQAIGVADGGTGLQTVTTNAILYGQGTSALAEASGSAYQVLQLDASGIPVFGGIDGGSY